jgi:hypothetical protein
LKSTKNQEDQAIAEVGGIILYKKELAALLPIGIAGSDSASLAQKTVNDWIKKQLILAKAKSEIAYDEKEIERKVTDYRYELVTHEFEKFYINAHLNKEVSSVEIQAYYDQRPANFLLKQNIVKCLYVKIPSDFSGMNQLRRNIRSYPTTNKSDIEAISYQYASQSFLEDSLWVSFDEVIMNTPLKGMANKVQFLENTTFTETRDNDYTYLLRIIDYKTSENISPIEFVKEDIVNIIINKRKLALKKELEKTIYEEAKKSKKFEIFTR